MQLAPLGVVVEKLRARSPAVRIAALAHLVGHGASARPFAARVAALLTDQEDVSWHAARALGTIAPGATDAVPVLMEQLGQPGAAEVVVRRALVGLQRVGQEAWAALPLLETLLTGPHRAEVVEAMAAIAPDNPRVTAAIIGAVFDASFNVSRAGCDALRRGSPALVDLASAQLRLNAFSFSKRKRDAAHMLLYDFAPLRPEATTQLMLELARGSNPRKWILRAMQQLPRPPHPALADCARSALSHPDVDVQKLAQQALEAEGVPRKASSDAEPEAPGAGAGPLDFPEIPEDMAPPPPGRLEPASAPDQPLALENGLKVLGLGPTARPLQLAEGLQAYLARRQREQLPSPDAEALEGLAAVWACCLTQGCRWTWAFYVRGLDEKALVLASPDGGSIVFPSAWVRRQLIKREPTALLQFNMISENKEPPRSSEPVALW